MAKIVYEIDDIDSAREYLAGKDALLLVTKHAVGNNTPPKPVQNVLELIRRFELQPEDIKLD